MRRPNTLYVLTLAVSFRAICAFLDSHQQYGSWNSYSTCSLFLAPAPDPNGAQHNVTCGLRLLAASNTTVLGQSLACDCKTPTTHGKDFMYLELAQQGSVVTRLPGVHRGRGVHEFYAWNLVKPGSYDAKFVMGATATRDFLCGISVDALRQDYLWQTKALMNDTSAVLLTTTLQKEQSQPAAVPAAVEERRRCSAGSRWKGQWVALVNSTAACPPGVCRGNPGKVLQLDSATNRGMGFSHVYAPWQCGPYTLYDGPACLAGKRLAFIGNSRTYQLMEFVKAHLGVEHVTTTVTGTTHGSSALNSDSGGRGSSSSKRSPVEGYGHGHGGPAPRGANGPHPPPPPQPQHSSRRKARDAHGHGHVHEHRHGRRVLEGGGGSRAGNGGGSGPSIHWVDLQPYRMGLRRVLADVNLTQLLLDNDFVFINSILHDIVNYKDEAHVRLAKNLGRWSYDMGPGTVGASACAPTNASQALFHKYRPVQQFEEALRGFVEEVQHARAAIRAAAAASTTKRRRAISGTPGSGAHKVIAQQQSGGDIASEDSMTGAPARMGRLVWLMHGYRPGPLPNPCFPNNPERMVCLQHLALKELERAGVEVVDLATIEMDSPAQWFYDAVHIAGAAGIQRWGSGLELMAVQVLLNSVCGPGPGEAAGL